MAKAKKKSAKEASNIFHSIMKASVTIKSTQMNDTQTSIIEVIKKDSFRQFVKGKDQEIAMIALYDLLPNIDKKDIQESVSHWKGIKVTGNFPSAVITIPAKYFE